jgi:glutamate synthase (NADPH/NADH) large chain
MADLGYRTVNEMVGQVDSLQLRDNISHWKYKSLDLSPILYREPAADETGLYKQEEQDHGISEVIDWRLLKAAQPALEKKARVFQQFPVRNTDRAIGTILSNEISKRYGGPGLPEDTIHYKFVGSAGQSFGAFNTKGVTLELEGEANDYFGKGLSGAKLILYPSPEAGFKAEENIIAGNVAFYGATSGEAYIRGKAGERFCVRNSGATIVTEGVGDHGCEYMTGGKAVILGETGRNFGAGMSGGIAYVYDVNGSFAGRCNKEMIDLDPLDQDDAAELQDLITKHHAYTNSTVAKFILKDWENQLRHFVKVFPKEYKAVLKAGKAAAQKVEK